MKISFGDSKEYEVEGEILDLLSLSYGNKLLEQIDNLDSTLQFGMKLVTKAVSKKLLESFGVNSKLPRGSDPTVFLVKAYIVLMRESLQKTHLKLTLDEQAQTVVDGKLTYDDMADFVAKMGVYLERLKGYGADSLAALGESDDSGSAALSSGSAGTELAADGDAAVGQDDGWQNHRTEALRALS